MTAMLHHYDADDVSILKKAKNLDFEKIDTASGGGVAVVPSGYGKLSWSNFYAIDASTVYPDNPESGYYKGTTSGSQAILNGFASPADVYLDGGSFTLKSVEMTAAWDKKLVVDIYGFKDGTQIYHDTVILNDKHPTLVTLNYKGVDDVEFVSTSGTPDPKQSFTGDHMVLDDMIVSAVKPAAGAPVQTAPHHVSTAHVDLHALTGHQAINAPHLDLTHAVHAIA